MPLQEKSALQKVADGVIGKIAKLQTVMGQLDPIIEDNGKLAARAKKSRS
jgi:hypothetical protein